MIKKVKKLRDEKSILALKDLTNYMFKEESKNKTILEVGSFIGESTVMFCSLFNMVYCIDTWEWVVYENTNNAWFISTQNPTDTEIEFDKNIKHYKNFVKIKGNSIIYGNLFKDNLFDCVYIDAMHDYDNVKFDINMWYPKVKVGGYICGHDYTPVESNGGVIKAVNEIFTSPDKIFDDTSWCVKKNL